VTPLLRHPAKRRLAEHGVAGSGGDEARMAAAAIAFELRLQGVSAEEAREVVRQMPVLGGRPDRRLLKRMEASVTFAYATEQPILSGCCQDPRGHSDNAYTEAMRRSFARYCDEECARTCPMLLSIKNPSRSLHGTPYEALDRSNLWMHGGGLGNAGRTAFQTIAQIAHAQDSPDVQASANFLCLKSDGAFTRRQFGKALRLMDELGIVTLLHKRTGHRRVHSRDEAWITAKEKELGVNGRRASNKAEARRNADGFAEYAARELAAWATDEQDDALADWNPAPDAPEPQEGAEGRRLPRGARSWGGLVGGK
jgi:hypothetical protein